LKCGSSKCKYETHTVSIHEYKNETELQNVLKNISTDALILADPTRPIFDIFIKNSPNSSSFKPKIDKGIDVIIKQLFT